MTRVVVAMMQCCTGSSCSLGEEDWDRRQVWKMKGRTLERNIEEIQSRASQSNRGGPRGHKEEQDISHKTKAADHRTKGKRVTVVTGPGAWEDK